MSGCKYILIPSLEHWMQKKRKKVISEIEIGMNLVWENVTVELPNNMIGQPRKLLSELNGYAEPGRLLAIMGPSGSGKSTLLDSLAGRLPKNVTMTGKVIINGKKRSINCEDVSYVTQEDFFLGTLTVKEILTYSANLRISSKMSKQEIDEIVENTIMEMGLQDCADHKLGNWHLRGISTGEKKRLSIAIEILTHPRILFLDEPTTGLDSASAFFVIQALKNIAYDGKIVICSIHQPSSEVFNLFDDLLLLSSGETVYFGEAKMAIKFFDEAGFPCPQKRNPSDHFLRCISLDFDRITEAMLRSHKLCGILESSDHSVTIRIAEIREKLIHKYKSSGYSINTRSQKSSSPEDNMIDSIKGSYASWWKQLLTLTSRSFVHMYRDIGYYWLRIGFYAGIAICLGTLFFNMGNTSGGIVARGKSLSFVYGFMICLSNGGLPFFIDELKVYRKERLGRHYGEVVLVLSNFLASFPYIVLTAILSGTIIYYMTKLHSGFSHLSFFCISLFCCISIVESCMMIVASVVPNVLTGMGVGTGVIVFMMMASQIFRPISDLPRIFWRYPMSYLSFASWAVQGEFKNEMIGLEFDPFIPGDTKVKGEVILETLFGVPLTHSKWWDLLALVVLLLAHRILFYLVLKYRAKMASFFSKIHAKTSLQQHMNRKTRRYPIAREGFSTSRRHQTPHPLAAQEGLRSPI